MNLNHRDHWVSEVLRTILRALIEYQPLQSFLVFKGARILNLYLGESRQSLDIDSNLTSELNTNMPGLEDQKLFLQEHVSKALQRYFEKQNPIVFELGRVKVVRKPPKGHPRGWDGFRLNIEVQDNRLKGIRGLPMLELDVAAPEPLGPGAIVTMDIDGISARVYSLQRISGEKLRAYLTSLPSYRQRMSGGERDFRVKDLHDLARILRHRPISDAEFWTMAGDEFQLACESRLVNCLGLASFMEAWALARQRYEADESLRSVSFPEAEQALKTMVEFFQRQGIFPLQFTIA